MYAYFFQHCLQISSSLSYNKSESLMFEKQKQSPYKTHRYHSLQHSKQTTVKQLELIFTYYAGRSSKYNYQQLPEKYFTQIAVQLMQLAHIKVDKRSQRWMSISTLYYTKGRSKPLYFSHFLELLPALGRCLFSQGSSPRKQGYEVEQQLATKNLLILFDQLYHRIMEEQIYRRGVVSQEIADDCKEFLLKIKDSLVKLYKIYFEYETSFRDRDKDYHNQSFEAWLQMMKQFEVFPKLLSASQLFFVYNQVLNEHKQNHLTLLTPSLYSKQAFPRLGQYFTLSRMVQALSLTSHLAVSKLKRVQGEELLYGQTGMSQKEAVKLLLEYMETMRNAKGKNAKYSRQRFCLIVYEEYGEYVGLRQESMTMSREKSLVGTPEQKKSFFDILNKIDI